jgi:hypothetical protein
VPPDTVSVLLFAQTVKVAQALTVIVVVATYPQVREKLITCVPAPATEGSNTPVVALVIPAPLQVPLIV